MNGSCELCLVDGLKLDPRGLCGMCAGMPRHPASSTVEYLTHRVVFYIGGVLYRELKEVQRLLRQVTCKACDGKGESRLPGSGNWYFCTECNGTGKVDP